MTNTLTVKQENFCMAYVETGNASKAYRLAYNAGGMKDTSINVKACELLKNGKVTVRLEELRTDHAYRHNVTIDSLIDDLFQAQELAKQEGQAGAYISAIKLKAQLYGLLVKQVEQDKETKVSIMTFTEFFKDKRNKNAFDSLYSNDDFCGEDVPDDPKIVRT